jgi:DNA-binding NarL/FixJ family response regulator
MFVAHRDHLFHGVHFSAANAAETAEEALKSARKAEPGITILDHGLGGLLTGLDAAPLLKELAPRAKIILFTAHAELQTRATAEPAVDAFLLKTDPTRLLPLAQRLTGLNIEFPEVRSRPPTPRDRSGRTGACPR